MEKYVITIARGYGSGGRTIGTMLAKELGIHYYDRELLRLASDESGINENLFGKADERLHNGLLDKIIKKTYKEEFIPPDSDDFISNDNLFNYQAKIIRQLAENESCVIVGRCADYVLRELPNVVSLFIHAPLEHCINTLEELYGEPRKELEKKVMAIDKYRGNYYSYFTGRQWNDARNYDLCINTAKFSFEQALDLVKSYMNIKMGELH